MGGTSWAASDWVNYAATTSSKSRHEIYTAKTINKKLDPLNFKGGIRESRDSTVNPLSTPIILGIDNTGSMGALSEQIIKRDLGVIMGSVYDLKPVTNPHIMAAVVGDHENDKSPIQATQFEADISIAKQMEDFYIEGNGGGNGGESYHLAWWLAAFHTACDSIIKRKKPGYLFTVGDECVLPDLPLDDIKKLFGTDLSSQLDDQNFVKLLNDKRDAVLTDKLLERVCESWNVFHLIVKPVSTQPVVKSWEKLLGAHAIYVQDVACLGEVIVSTMQVNEGTSVDAAVSAWDGSTAISVSKSLKKLASVKGAGDIEVQ